MRGVQQRQPQVDVGELEADGVGVDLVVVSRVAVAVGVLGERRAGVGGQQRRIAEEVAPLGLTKEAVGVGDPHGGERHLQAGDRLVVSGQAGSQAIGQIHKAARRHRIQVGGQAGLDVHLRSGAALEGEAAHHGEVVADLQNALIYIDAKTLVAVEVDVDRIERIAGVDLKAHRIDFAVAVVVRGLRREAGGPVDGGRPQTAQPRIGAVELHLDARGVQGQTVEAHQPGALHIEQCGVEVGQQAAIAGQRRRRGLHHHHAAGHAVDGKAGGVGVDLVVVGGVAVTIAVLSEDGVGIGGQNIGVAEEVTARRIPGKAIHIGHADGHGGGFRAGDVGRIVGDAQRRQQAGVGPGERVRAIGDVRRQAGGGVDHVGGAALKGERAGQVQIVGDGQARALHIDAKALVAVKVDIDRRGQIRGRDFKARRVDLAVAVVIGGLRREAGGPVDGRGPQPAQPGGAAVDLHRDVVGLQLELVQAHSGHALGVQARGVEGGQQRAIAQIGRQSRLHQHIGAGDPLQHQPHGVGVDLVVVAGVAIAVGVPGVGQIGILGGEIGVGDVVIPLHHSGEAVGVGHAHRQRRHLHVVDPGGVIGDAHGRQQPGVHPRERVRAVGDGGGQTGGGVDLISRPLLKRKRAGDVQIVAHRERSVVHRDAEALVAVEVQIERLPARDHLKAGRIQLAVVVAIFAVQHAVVVQILTGVQHAVAVDVLGGEQAVVVKILAEE
ncbi:putative membrane protein, IniB [Magnetofaba australis IT-1]|uniref:Putative membrane protein, IniB n=1 Tax=Magnetofaba australis IT-1 TaxID=1434232 RepID=A0A1Y2K411_9PROT|nr:putative membrane protein, IniB [Magnetofaba australis IT-1]